MVGALFGPFVAREVEIGSGLPLNILLERIAALDPARFEVVMDRAQVAITQRAGGPRLKLEGRAASTTGGSALEGRLYHPSVFASVPAALGLVGLALAGAGAALAAGAAPVPQALSSILASPSALWPGVAGLGAASVAIYVIAVAATHSARVRFSNAVADAILPAGELS